jgi:hypothetical protein
MESKFTGAFFEARKSTGSYYDPADYWLRLCAHIVENDKFSQRPDQNKFERSVVASCIERLDRGRLLSPAQQNLVMKMYRRKGPVMFCGHRE